MSKILLVEDDDLTLVEGVLQTVGHHATIVNSDGMVELFESKDKFESIFHALPDILMEVDIDGNCYSFHAPDHGKLTFDNLGGKNLLDNLPDKLAQIGKDAINFLKTNGTPPVGIQYEVNNHWFELNISKMKYPKEHYIVLSRDITDRKLIEDKYKFIVDNAPIGIFQRKKNGEYLLVNNVEKKSFECSEEEYFKRYTDGPSKWDDQEKFLEYQTQLEDKKVVKNVEVKKTLENGKIKWFLISSIYDGEVISGFSIDITERKINEEKIQKLLIEKDLILKEIHHRIKNNMATISSLLNLQMRSLEDPEAISALQDANNRVQSMLILYEKLYQSTDFKNIRADEYLFSLTKQIFENFPNCSNVQLKIKIEEFELDSKTIQPLGIVINELLTNIMKYAFVNQEFGTITVNGLNDNGHIKISICDDGPGIPENITFEHSTGFGLMLVEMLIKQIGGRIYIDRSNGTKIVIEFDKECSH
jgi:PAS domain S-box-containing protein